MAPRGVEVLLSQKSILGFNQLIVGTGKKVHKQLKVMNINSH